MSLILRTETVLLVYYTHMMLYFDLITAGLPESQNNVARRKIWEQGGVCGGLYFPWSPQGTSLASTRILQVPAPGMERGRRDQWKLSLLSDLKPGEGREKGFWFGSQLQVRAAEDAGSHSACDALLQLTLNESPGKAPPCLPPHEFNFFLGGKELF